MDRQTESWWSIDDMSILEIFKQKNYYNIVQGIRIQTPGGLCLAQFLAYNGS